jgi:hypothetical protein
MEVVMRTPSYEEIRRSVESRYNRFFWFIFHVIMAVVTTGVIWAIDPTPEDGTPVIAALWVGVLIGHAVKVYMDGLKDAAIERTWQQYYGDLEMGEVEIIEEEKPKRMARLMDEDEDDVAYEHNGHGQHQERRQSGS